MADIMPKILCTFTKNNNKAIINVAMTTLPQYIKLMLYFTICLVKMKIIVDRVKYDTTVEIAQPIMPIRGIKT
jgi:hypothetical protein